MSRDTTKLHATARGGVTTPEWDQAVNLISSGPFRELIEDLLGYLDVGLPVSPLANEWMREQSDRAARLMEHAVEQITRGATALERIAALFERAETSVGAASKRTEAARG
jgi:hypothetical protein